MLEAVQHVWLGKEESSHSEKAIPGHLPSWAVNLPDCQYRHWTASARWLNSGLLWGSWKHRNPSRESRAAFHLAAVQLLCHHLTGHLSHLINFLFFFSFAQNQLSIFIGEIWGSFRCVSCLPLNACGTCCDLWQGCLYSSSCSGARRLPRDGNVSEALCSVWTSSATAFRDTCCFMSKPGSNSLPQKEHLQRTRKKRAASAIFCYLNLVAQAKLCNLPHIAHCNGHFIFAPFCRSTGVSEPRLELCYIASMFEMIWASVLSR